MTGRVFPNWESAKANEDDVFSKELQNGRRKHILFQTKLIQRDFMNKEHLFQIKGVSAEDSKTYTRVEPRITYTDNRQERIAFEHYKYLKETYGDDALLTEYKRCPQCNEIYHIQNPCECLKARADKAKIIIAELKVLAKAGKLIPYDLFCVDIDTDLRIAPIEDWLEANHPGYTFATLLQDISVGEEAPYTDYSDYDDDPYTDDEEYLDYDELTDLMSV
jgi:hypothetical protein